MFERPERIDVVLHPAPTNLNSLANDLLRHGLLLAFCPQRIQRRLARAVGAGTRHPEGGNVPALDQLLARREGDIQKLCDLATSVKQIVLDGHGATPRFLRRE